ncbi:hypothetical protein ACWV26_12610 [Rummeliibacillus sp. JY-2-4R]
MSNKEIPKSHGMFGREEMGEDFSAQPIMKKVKTKKSNFELFKEKRKKSNETARQNLE